MVSDRDVRTLTSRECLRREIEQQTQYYLRSGGRIDVLRGPSLNPERPIGPVWWDTRGSGPLLSAL